MGEHLDIHGTLQARGHSYNGYPVWAVYNTKSFDEAITKSVNLLGDADSHGSIAGQLAGALYGYNGIHPQFRTWLHKWDEYEFPVRAVLLHSLGKTAFHSGYAQSQKAGGYAQSQKPTPLPTKDMVE